MTLNHNKSIKTIRSLLCMPCQKGNTQYTKVLIDLLWFNIVHYSSPLFWSTMVPTLVVYLQYYKSVL